VEVIITYHTFVQTSSSESAETNSEIDVNQLEESEIQTETTIDQVEDSITETTITIENNDDFAAILLTKDEFDPIIRKFAQDYKNQTIEFDACIVYLTNSGSYDTRYDILINAGDYVDADTVNPGPYFKFADVNTFNMGIEDLFLPSYMSNGQNIHVVAEISKYDSNSGLFILEPISIKSR